MPGVSSAKRSDARGSPQAGGATAGGVCDAQRIIVAQSLHLDGCGTCFSVPSGQQGMSAIVADISASVAACATEGATNGAATRPIATNHTNTRRRIQRPFMHTMSHKPGGFGSRLSSRKRQQNPVVNQGFPGVVDQKSEIRSDHHACRDGRGGPPPHEDASRRRHCVNRACPDLPLSVFSISVIADPLAIGFFASPFSALSPDCDS